MPNQSKPKTDSKSSQPKTIEEALARFQMEHHAAGKDGKANYGTYTTLAGGLNAVQPATHLGLSHTQTFEHIVVGEKVHIVNINNGERLETYVIEGKYGSGEVTINGPAARKAQKGDKIIIISYAQMEMEKARE